MWGSLQGVGCLKRAITRSRGMLEPRDRISLDWCAGRGTVLLARTVTPPPALPPRSRHSPIAHTGPHRRAPGRLGFRTPQLPAAGSRMENVAQPAARDTHNARKPQRKQQGGSGRGEAGLVGPPGRLTACSGPGKGGCWECTPLGRATAAPATAGLSPPPPVAAAARRTLSAIAAELQAAARRTGCRRPSWVRPWWRVPRRWRRGCCAARTRGRATWHGSCRRHAASWSPSRAG